MRLRELSIIQYQNVTPTPNVHRLWLSIDAFRKQVDYLAAKHFEILSMDDAIHYMERKKGIANGRPISLTFDNGYQGFHEYVFPVLAQNHFPATLFISPLRVGKSVHIGTTQVDYLSWDMLNELIRNEVMIGAYEDSARDFNHVPEEVVRRHIIDYKKILEDKLGVEICYFGVKEGVPNENIRHLLVSEGYRAFLTECPTNRKPDLYAIGRIQVDDEDFNIFLTKISRTYLFFKDKKSWKYIREYSMDKLAHKISETYDKIRGATPH